MFDTCPQGNGGAALITDFVSGTDTIALSREVFNALGDLEAGRLEEFGDLLGFDVQRNTLAYDADGPGAAPPSLW
ncbi:MAG: hypothetical protein VYD90_11305 [Pseudomonadota bacterium]|nr:hypothetical protein [Pseudomonadota bacterium]